MGDEKGRVEEKANWRWEEGQCEEAGAKSVVRHMAVWARCGVWFTK